MLRELFRYLRRALAGQFGDLPESHRRGRRGEELAEQWLRQRQGWTRVARNWRAGRGELDLVLRAPNGLLVFVEVRSRAAHAKVQGFDSITRHKRRVLRRTVEAYLRKLRGSRPTWRFDVVEIAWRKAAEPEIRHFENVRL